MLEINTSKYSAILLDFDGTIVDTEELHYFAYKTALKKIGIEYIPLEDHIKSNVGHNTEEVLRTELIKHSQPLAALDELVVMKRFIFAQKLNEGVKAMDGAIDFIYKIKQKGLKTAVVTGGRYEAITRVMMKAGIPNIFDVIVTKEMFEKYKPDPQSYQKALDLLNIEPKKCLAFENDLAGFESARSAKIECISITKYDFFDEITKKYPDAQKIASFKEITII